MSDKSKSAKPNPEAVQQKVFRTYAQDGLDVASTQIALERARQQIQANANNNDKGKKQ